MTMNAIDISTKKRILDIADAFGIVPKWRQIVPSIPRGAQSAPQRLVILRILNKLPHYPALIALMMSTVHGIFQRIPRAINVSRWFPSIKRNSVLATNIPTTRWKEDVCWTSRRCVRIQASVRFATGRNVTIESMRDNLAFNAVQMTMVRILFGAKNRLKGFPE